MSHGVWIVLACISTGWHWLAEASNGTASHHKVIILGAGSAGLSAAKILSENKVTDFLILEGSDRVGGRVKNMKFGSKVVEVGANWIYGTDGNPLWQLAKKNNITGIVSNYESVVVRNSTGSDVTDGEAKTAWQKLAKADKKIKALYEKIKSRKKQDMTIRAGLEFGGWFPESPVEKVVEAFDYDFETANIPDLSSVKEEKSIFGSFKAEEYFVSDPRGFSYIFEDMSKTFLAENDPRLKFNSVVSRIDTRESKIKIETKAGKTYTADYVIVTFGVGVLKHGLVEFNPPLPETKLEAMFRMRLDSYIPIFLKFPASQTKFWGDSEYMLYAGNFRGEYPVWQNMEAKGLFPAGSNILLVSAFGEEAQRLGLLSDDEIKAEAVGALRKAFGTPSIADPEAVLVYRWHKDPLFMGSFTNIPPYYRKSYHADLEAPVGKMYFAGEAYSEMYNGYVHGAMMSGERTAMWVVKCMNGNCRAHVKPSPPKCVTSSAGGLHILIFAHVISFLSFVKCQF